MTTSERDFDALMAALDPPMAVVTTTDGRERGGCLIGFHAQSSIGPGRYTVWLSKANHTYRLALRAEHLAIHFLDRRQVELAELFGTTSGDHIDKFERCGPVIERYGVPLLEEVPNRIFGPRVALLDEGGDHVCTVIEPVEVGHVRPFEPMRLSQVSHLEAGHQAEERHVPPTERAAGSAS